MLFIKNKSNVNVYFQNKKYINVVKLKTYKRYNYHLIYTRKL